MTWRQFDETSRYANEKIEGVRPITEHNLGVAVSDSIGVKPLMAYYRMASSVKEVWEVKMAKRVDNECAYCAEEVEMIENGIIGRDWKLYCSTQCANRGEVLSLREMERVMSLAIPSRQYVSLDQSV